MALEGINNNDYELVTLASKLVLNELEKRLKDMKRIIRTGIAPLAALEAIIREREIQETLDYIVEDIQNKDIQGASKKLTR